ncbi:hypothetical protein LCGC14_2751000 [marine sediment metagenome]|uniref:DUF2232 domain-containing protein n=1 Tax=marine sediment metagenome TaxID=412755 RepID=A0A0F8Z1N4_9ZZZZ
MAPQTMQKEISKDIASGIAITIAIFGATIYMPIIGFFCSLLLPLPVLFYRSKLGRSTGSIIPVASIALMIVILGRASIDILFFGELLLLGFVLSELIEMNLSVEKTICYAVSAVLLTGTFGLLLHGSIARIGIQALVSDYVAKNLQLTMAIYENMGVSEDSIHLISNSLENIQYVLVRIFPSLVIGSTLFVAWVNLLIAKPMLTARKLFFSDFGSLNLWKAPDFLVWGAIGCGLTLLLPSKALKMFGLNGLIILMIVYFFEGIAIVSFYFEKKQFPRMLRLFAYSLIALQQVVLLIVIGFGIFDMWLDFRKLRINKEN